MAYEENLCGQIAASERALLQYLQGDPARGYPGGSSLPLEDEEGLPRRPSQAQKRDEKDRGGGEAGQEGGTVDTEAAEVEPRGHEEEEAGDRLPRSRVRRIRLLGVPPDEDFSFGRHLDRALEKPKLDWPR